MVTGLFDHLKAVQRKLTGAADPEKKTALLVKEERLQAEEQLKKELEAGHLDKVSETAKRQILMWMEGAEKAGDFEAVRASFAAEADGRQQLIDETSEKLEYAFDFLEAAFGQGQELVLFVTELTAGFFSAWFIRENGCDRYYKYNKGLLFAERGRAISDRIEEAKELMTGADLSMGDGRSM